MSIRYLTVNEVIEINKRMILMYNDKEQIGVKDYSLLESAVYRPQQSVFGEDAYSTVWHKATALFESIGKNHAFQNGNKRTALTCLVIFLHLNGIHFKMDQQKAEDFTVDMVNGKYSFKELSRIIQLSSSLKR